MLTVIEGSQFFGGSYFQTCEITLCATLTKTDPVVHVALLGGLLAAKQFDQPRRWHLLYSRRTWKLRKASVHGTRSCTGLGASMESPGGRRLVSCAAQPKSNSPGRLRVPNTSRRCEQPEAAMLIALRVTTKFYQPQFPNNPCMQHCTPKWFTWIVTQIYPPKECTYMDLVWGWSLIGRSTCHKDPPGPATCHLQGEKSFAALAEMQERCRNQQAAPQPFWSFKIWGPRGPFLFLDASVKLLGKTILVAKKRFGLVFLAHPLRNCV